MKRSQKIPLKHFGRSVKNYEEALNFRVSLNEETKSNLKLLKGAMLRLCAIKTFMTKRIPVERGPYRSRHQGCSMEKGVLRKETLSQVFFCEFCEISKSTFLTEHLWTTASVHISIHVNITNSSPCKCNALLYLQLH